MLFAAYIRQKLIHNKFPKIARRWKQEISEARADHLEAGRGAGGADGESNLLALQVKVVGVC